ncbi:GDSL-type esterase/lipase family protein [Dactylosporangium sp. NPDC051484]|uniref:GDSL-type esterase/lipase family protein n=1 Tax=Dactylosporangium sp. NPDC051484 TaxID=3154942 RepID=UPI00344BE1A1
MTSVQHHISADLRQRHGTAIRIGDDCDLAADVAVEIDDGGLLVLGDRVSIRRGTTIQVHRGATITIGDDVAIGEHVFLSAMIGIRIGAGVGISNMVDLHDHSHRDRSTTNVPDGDLKPWASGFAGAPIIIESGAVLSNKVTITAGVRIGQNVIVGANAVVTRSVPPNTVVAGAPATAVRTFDGPIRAMVERHTVRFGWFGTSVMEHLEGHSPQLVNQANLPPVGSTVPVVAWRNRGYVQRLQLALQVDWPHLDIVFANHGEGGATSRNILRTVEAHIEPGAIPLDLAVFGCGINDVWRRFQGRHAEAVDPDEYAANYRHILARLIGTARQVLCIGETPFGWDSDHDIAAMNLELARYNTIAAEAATAAGVPFLDIWPTFVTTARQLATAEPGLSLWSDGVHLSELGDTLLLGLVTDHLREQDTMRTLSRYHIFERDQAQATYRHLFRTGTSGD